MPLVLTVLVAVVVYMAVVLLIARLLSGDTRAPRWDDRDPIEGVHDFRRHG